jgi:hypothetical protein
MTASVKGCLMPAHTEAGLCRTPHSITSTRVAKITCEVKGKPDKLLEGRIIPALPAISGHLAAMTQKLPSLMMGAVDTLRQEERSCR